MFLNSINHFRAIAIVIIVAGHLYGVSGIKFDSFSQNVIGNLITGGTINFVFISGFLFHSVFYNRFKYSKFLKSKMKRVLVPYFFLSVIPILFSLYTVPDYWNRIKSDDVIFGMYFISSLKFLISGSHLIAYWYIPFIILVFLMSPLHIKFIQLKFTNQILILILLGLVSLFIHRPFERIEVFQAIHSLVYFTPIYLFGIICSMHKDKIYKAAKNKELVLLLAAVLLAVIQAYLGQNGNYMQPLSNISGIVDLVLIQKTIMCLFFMVWLNRFENITNPYVNTVAKFSFPIFFLHPYFLSFSFRVKSHFNINFDYPWLMLIGFTLFFGIGSILVAKLIGGILPKYSVMLIGYGKKKKNTKFKKNLVEQNLAVSKA